MPYDEFPPPPPLRRAVVCYWSVTAARERVQAPGGLRRILPDGCFDLMFVLGSPRSVAALAVGPMTRAIVTPAPPAMPDLFGIRFRPGRASRVFGLPLGELRDQVVPAAPLFGGDLERLADQLAGAVAVPARVALASAFLVTRLERRSPHPVVVARVEAILSGALAGRGVERIANDLNVSTRHLERIALRDLGFRPKELIRLTRFRRAFARLRNVPALSLGRLAHELGYADQAHFTREFKAFAGLPPSAFAASTGVDDGSDLFKAVAG